MLLKMVTYSLPRPESLDIILPARFTLNDKIQYCKLTHLNIAFANPQTDGTMVLPGNSGDLLKNVMDTARSLNSNIKIYIALAGGWLSDEMCEHMEKFSRKPSGQTDFN